MTHLDQGINTIGQYIGRGHVQHIISAILAFIQIATQIRIAASTCNTVVLAVSSRPLALYNRWISHLDEPGYDRPRDFSPQRMKVMHYSKTSIIPMRENSSLAFPMMHQLRIHA